MGTCVGYSQRVEELASELRALSKRIELLTYVALLIAVTFVGMILGLETAAGRAGPRLVEMRKRSDALLEENNRLRAEVEAARKHSTP